MSFNEPYLPEITLKQILAFRPDDEQTYTSSRLVNAVANVLFTSLTREPGDFAQRLQIEKRHLSNAIEVITGMSLYDLIVQYRVAQIRQYMGQNPEKSNIVVAEHMGFSSPHALWRFFQIHTGETPSGQKSEAMRVDTYHERERQIKGRK